MKFKKDFESKNNTQMIIKLPFWEVKHKSEAGFMVAIWGSKLDQILKKDRWDGTRTTSVDEIF